MSGVIRERVSVNIYMCDRFELRAETRYRQPNVNAPETESGYLLNMGGPVVSPDDRRVLRAQGNHGGGGVMEVWDMLVLLPFDTWLRIVDLSGRVLFAGKRQDVPVDVRDMSVERFAPCHEHITDSDFLWIEVL